MLPLPYRCDAPIYHAPWGTIGLMIACALVTFSVDLEGGRAIWILQHGDAILPWQWFTSMLAHADWLHLFGNLIFLYVFGIIVEGKIGWLWFLAIVAGVAATDGLIEQLVMLGASPVGTGIEGPIYGGSLGISTVIFALMAIACCWAPLNRMDCVVIIIYFIRHFELPVWGLAVCHFLWALLGFALIEQGAMGSDLLHLMGTVIGLPIGLLTLQRDWVDSEGWDLLTIIRHGRPQSRPSRLQRETLETVASKREETVAQARALIDEAIAAGEWQVAERILANARLEAASAVEPTDEQRCHIARLAMGAGAHSNASVHLEALIAGASPQADWARRQLAAIAVVRRQPSRAAKLLDAIDRSALADKGRRQYEDLQRQVDTLQQEGVLEVLD